MSQTIQYILIAAAVIVLLLIGLKLFKATFKTIFTIVLNAVIGALAHLAFEFYPRGGNPARVVDGAACGYFRRSRSHHHADRQSDQIVKAHPFGRAFFIRTLCLS